MRNIRFSLALAVVLVACEDSVGPKPPSAKSTIVEVVTTLSKTVINTGDTLTFTYSVKNISGAPLTLTTDEGCQIKPELDQVEGPTMPDLFVLNCPTSQTVRQMDIGETQTFKQILRAYDASKTTAQQTPGYLLTKGTFDASMLVTAKELGAAVRSDWVRFKVQ